MPGLCGMKSILESPALVPFTNADPMFKHSLFAERIKFINIDSQ